MQVNKLNNNNKKKFKSLIMMMRNFLNYHEFYFRINLDNKICT